MSTTVTNINTLHDPHVLPTGLIDDFARDDGWPCDRPATCGNFWEQQGDLPSYLASGALTGPPGGTYSETLMYLGGASLAVQADIDNGPSSLGSSAAWAFDLMSDGPNTLERFRFEQAQSGGLLRYIDSAGTPTTLGTFAGYSYSTAYRWTFSATPVPGGILLRAVRENIGGGSPTVMVSTIATQTPSGQWISWGCRPGQTLDNIYRVASPVLFSDTFDRANSSTTLGPDWTASSGTWGITSNEAYCAVSGNGRAALHDVGQGDYTIETLITLASGSDMGIWFRWVDPNNCWLLALNPLAPSTLFRAVAGSFVSQGTGPSPVNGDTWQVVCSGSSIHALRNGSVVISVTDSTNATATLLGLRSQNDTVSRWDYITVVA